MNTPSEFRSGEALTPGDVYRLLELPENEYYDRKQCFHDNNAKLLHDILCLCNAYAESDRFLLFGVADDGRLVGVEQDSNLKTNAQLQDLLNKSHFNRLPTISLSTHEIDGHTIAVLRIYNRQDKPFFLTRDSRDGTTRVRAGVVYTRIGDTNTPIDHTATDEQIEIMWRERFGFDQPILARFKQLLGATEKWMSAEGESYLYHSDYPEFVVQRRDRDSDAFHEPWTQCFPDPSARSYEVWFSYGGTIVHRSTFISCDGNRYQIPLPRLVRRGEYELYTDTLEFRLAQLYWQYLPLLSELKRAGIRIVDGLPPISDTRAT